MYYGSKEATQTFLAVLRAQAAATQMANLAVTSPPAPAPVAVPSPPPSSLPSGWAEHVDAASGKVYYHHATSGKTQWEKPTTPSHTSPPPPPPTPPTPSGSGAAAAGGGGGGGAGAGVSGSNSRLTGDLEIAITMLPITRWEDVVPTRSCSEELRENGSIRALVPLIDAIVEDCEMKVMELPYIEPPLPVQLPQDELFAIIAYTHDTQAGDKGSNLYFQLNRQLRKRGGQERQAMVRVWGSFVHFALKVICC
jgi:hypothetical protein